MSDEKFTQGEWEVVHASSHHGYYVQDDNGVTVCDLYYMSNGRHYHHQNKFDAKPNAHLIAAAPEMYRLLETISDYYKLTGGECHHESEIESLLAKARGEHE